MIRSNNTINIEGSVIDQDELREYLSIDENSPKIKWLIKPLVVASGVGLAAAAVFASVFMMAVLLVVVPLLGIAAWAMKPKSGKTVNQTGTAAETPASAVDQAETGTPNSA